MPATTPHAIARAAFNRTRGAYLATRVELANTSWTRLRGLIGRSSTEFPQGSGLWIVPCRGVHTWAMSFPIDVVYLTRDQVILHLEPGLPPWRFAPVRFQAASVLELPADTLRATGTTIGDQLEFRDFGQEKFPGHD
ncbi:MAG TPA: DUF192 domain-containing protein [Candidatus Sulfotelmatobacter sp.]|nr:DUF192 domain-containing protein [Candidatus Sulfotelmatobacter sp.]